MGLISLIAAFTNDIKQRPCIYCKEFYAYTTYFATPTRQLQILLVHFLYMCTMYTPSKGELREYESLTVAHA
jgi:hypothetical protein